MALDVEFVLLQPGHVELLSGRSSLQLSRDILIVVSDNSAMAKLRQHPSIRIRYLTGRERERERELQGYKNLTHFVIMPVVLTPSVR